MGFAAREGAGRAEVQDVTRAQRQALKDEILRAAARGEKIYPQ